MSENKNLIMNDSEIQAIEEEIKAAAARESGFETRQIEIVVGDITKMHTDCVVNAANKYLQAGGGVCGAIFSAAGIYKLQAACDKIGGCHTGDAVITPGFNLKAKYIVHAVGPRYRDGRSGERDKLYNCYQASLARMLENDCESIAFPLISSGIFGYPKEEAWEVALTACVDFIDAHPEDDIHIVFTTLSEDARTMGQKYLQKVYNHYWAKKFAKYLGIMELISQDKVLSKWCAEFNAYQDNGDAHAIVQKWVYQFDDDCIRTDFGLLHGHNGLSMKLIGKVTQKMAPEIYKCMTPIQLRSCISYYVKGEKFNPGFMLNATGKGVLYQILKEWISREL